MAVNQGPGEHDLERLIGGMKPVLDPHTYVFATGATGADLPADLSPLMRFEESEGITLILTAETAEQAGLAATFPCRRITLTVHSALEAVGLMAAVAAALAKAGIGCNPVAGYHHDHLFVPAGRAGDAMRVLEALSRGTDFD